MRIGTVIASSAARGLIAPVASLVLLLGLAGAASSSPQAVLCRGMPATIVGTNGDDRIVGTPGNDVIHGLGGADEIDGLGGNDTICGGAGDDVLRGGDGNDELVGEGGADRLWGGDGIDNVWGGDGADELHGGAGTDNLIGGAGDDIFDGGPGIDIANFSGAPGPVTASLVTGTATGEGGDRLVSIEWLAGSRYGDVLTGASGDDRLEGWKGNDTLDGREGRDTLDGGEGWDLCVNGEVVRNCEATTGAGVASSGDGKIAFLRTLDGKNAEIFLVNADGSGEKRLTFNPAFDGDPAWSPDGKRIAFVSNRAGSYDIYVMRADGTGLERLTASRADESSPAWSPDGRKIAFDRSDRSGSDVYVMNANGTGVRALTRTRADGWATWSPDGRQIAFTSYRDRNYEIYVMDADGGNQSNLTRSARGDLWPQWSPDGGKILFASAPSRTRLPALYLMNADGSGQAPLVRYTGFQDGPGSWSPDGTRVAFFSTRDRRPGELYVVDANGGRLRRLTNNTVYDGFPAWQPLPSESGAVRATLVGSPTYTVVSVEDGDTIDVEAEDRRREKVRLVQIDAPELGKSGAKGECYAGRATGLFKTLLPLGTKVTLERDLRLDDRDGIERLLRYVRKGATNVNLELVERGAATVWFYPYDRTALGLVPGAGSYAREFLLAVTKAKDAGRGLWSACPRTPLDTQSPATTGYEWTFDSRQREGWQPNASIGAWSIEADGILRLDPRSPDPGIENRAVSIPSTEQFEGGKYEQRQYSRLVVRIASNAPDGQAAVFFLGRGQSGPFLSDQRIDFTVPTDSGTGRAPFRIICVPVYKNPRWFALKTITALRIDLADNPGSEGQPDTIGIDYISVEKGTCPLPTS